MNNEASGDNKITDLNIPDQVFPLSDVHIKKLIERTPAAFIMLTHPSWAENLAQYSEKYKFPIIKWEEEKPQDILIEISKYDLVIIAVPHGENKLADRIEGALDKLGSKTMVMRLLRDIFLKISLQLGGIFDRQENWKKCPLNSSNYLVFAIPRTGSTFFCDVLGKTKLLGYPREHLLIDHLPVFLNTDFLFSEWLDALNTYSFTPNAHSGTKIISHLFLEILNNYKKTPEKYDALLNIAKDKPVIYIKRMNKVRQAVSLIKARKTAVWHVKDNKEIVGAAPLNDINDDVEEINHTMNWFFDQEKNLEDYFNKASIHASVYFYEDFSDEGLKEKIFREVISKLKIIYDKPIPEANYRVLSDETNDAIVKKYYSELDNILKTAYSFSNSTIHCLLTSMTAEIRKRTFQSTIPHSNSHTQIKKWWKF